MTTLNKREKREPQLLDIVYYYDRTGVRRNDQIVDIVNGRFIGKFSKEKLDDQEFTVIDASISY